MAKYYYYKLTADNGGAPCVQDGLLSLAICKPALRRTAEEGDIIFGFAANSLYRDNRLIYVARITEKVRNRAYWSSGKFRQRRDSIYEWRNDMFILRSNHYHDVSHLEHDLGRPPSYSSANVLLSDDFRYFCSSGTDDYKTRYPLIKAAVEALMDGHRVNHPDALMKQLELLGDWAWTMASQPGVVRPSAEPLVELPWKGRSKAKPTS